MDDNILQARDIVKQYAGHLALDNVSIDVPRGSVYGLLGPNGAGKTTLIRIINHITAPDSGTVLFDGRPLTQDSVAHIGYLPEERGLYKKMKVGEQAMFFARLKGLGKKEAQSRLHDWFGRLEMDGWWNKKVEELSKGMAQKVQFVITVLHNPRLLIFDEPFSGFDPINANLLKNEILRLRDNGATVIFSTHNMSSVEEICDSITLVNRSRNILTGKVDDLRRQFGGNRWQITFEGDPQMAVRAIGPMATVKQVTLDPQPQIEIELVPGTARRDLIAAVNDAVQINAFTPVMPSMNNIFIQAVAQSGCQTQTTGDDEK